MTDFKINEPVNKNASEKARKLLEYLCEISGKKIITGQHTQTNPMEEVGYIEEITGRIPKLIGFELLSYSPNINYEDASKECLTEVYENRGTLEKAMEIGLKGENIITFSFHWFSPLYGRDKSFYAVNTEFDPSKILIEGTKERKAFYHDMDVLAGYLRPFCDKDIPILWRPFHESDGRWFWWGKMGPVVAKELYKLMYDYFVNTYHLNNLLWVWNCRLKKGYPGDEYVDVVSVDIYFKRYKKTDYAAAYNNLIKNTSDKKVAALGEVGYIPDVELLGNNHTPWAYYMTWSKEFCIGEQYNSKKNLKKMYDSSYSIAIQPGFTHVKHEFEPVYDKKSRILILGTFPSVKSREQNFYYGHPKNRFWNVIANLYGESIPQSVEEKKLLLLKHNIALWDVIAECDIYGSSDSSIKNVIPNDLSVILKDSGIDKIYANGAKAYELYMKYIYPVIGKDIVKLPSTSPANAAFGMEKLIDGWKKIIQ